MKIADLKAIIAGRSDDDEVFCTVDQKDYFGSVHAHPALGLIEAMAYINPVGETVVIYDHSKIEFGTPEEIAADKEAGYSHNALGYFGGCEVKSILMLTY